jgi:hypothetical protein
MMTKTSGATTTAAAISMVISGGQEEGRRPGDKCRSARVVGFPTRAISEAIAERKVPE